MSCDGWAALPRGATGLSAVYDFGISWSYSLTIFNNILYVGYLNHNNYRNEIILFYYFISRRLLDVHLFVLAYDLLNIGLKSLALMTATFFEWTMMEDSLGYTLLPSMYMYMKTSKYIFSTHNIFRKVGHIHSLYVRKFSLNVDTINGV